MNQLSDKAILFYSLTWVKKTQFSCKYHFLTCQYENHIVSENKSPVEALKIANRKPMHWYNLNRLCKPCQFRSSI